MANTTAYGFLSLEDLFADRVEQVGVQVVNDAVIESMAEHTREINALMSALVERTTIPKRRYMLTGAGSLQPLDQYGNPLPVQPSGKYDVAFPIQGAGTAWGDNRITRALMTVADANRFTLDAQARDADWMARHILAAIFTNTTWTYEDDNDEIGTLTIQPLANADAVTYVRRGGTSSTDTHYLAQANAIGNGADNPFPIIETELSEHPSNTGDIVAYVPTALVSTIQALSTFIPVSDEKVTPGSGTAVLTGAIAQGFGDKILGRDSGVDIVEWKRLPSTHMIALATGAPPVLGMREYAAASLQGLFPEFQDVDGNRHLNKLIRYAGFGVQNRVGALVYRIGNAAYAIPTGYTAPLSA